MPNLPDWISAAADLVIAVGLILTFLQVRQARRQMEYDHERSRREKAIDLLVGWSRANTREQQSARILGEQLSFDQARKIFLEQKVTLDIHLKDQLINVLDELEIEEKATEIRLDAKQASEVRSGITDYLNNLEGVLAAWRHNVADRHIIAEEFRGLISHDAKRYMLENFRDAAGGKHAYPAISQFVRWIRDQDEAAEREGKSPLAPEKKQKRRWFVQQRSDKARSYS